MNRKEKIKDILTRGVEDVVNKDILRKKLESGKKLKVKLGIDPTGPKIHLGRASQFWKLKAFQDLGHQIVFIIGDFTAQIGDASDKQAMRTPLTKEEIKENMKGYINQIKKILDIEKVELRYNSEWLSKMNIEEFITLARNFTAQQLIRRRNFKERWEQDKPIGLHEMIYPLLQGYDSVVVKADVEIGGFDQLFNLKTGRKIQKIFNQEPQQIMTFKMLYGLDGRKMSTSWDNIVTIVDEPIDMFGKIMSLQDELMIDYFRLCAFYNEKEINRVRKEVKSGNPKDVKKELAESIVKLYYGEKEAKKARKEFEKVFEKGENPKEMLEIKINEKEMKLLELVYATGLVKSKSEAKRLIKQGAVKVDGKKIQDWERKVIIKKGVVLQIGKRRFAKINL